MNFKKKLMLTCATVLTGLLAYASILHCTVYVVDSQGKSVANARVVVLHHQGLADVGAFIGVTDASGKLILRDLIPPHPFGSLSFHVVTPSDRGSGSNLMQWTRYVRIEVAEPPEQLKDYYSYDKPEKVWTPVNRFVKSEDWDLGPGESKFIPIAVLQAEEQRRLRSEQRGDH